MTPDEYCQQKAARSGSSFYYSFLFLPEERRRAIVALYAFCREVDDVVDECSDTGIASTKLAWWREEIDRLYAGVPQHPVTRALAPAVQTYALAQEHLRDIIDGMQMDLDYDAYPSFTELSLYCYRVAGVVGLLATRIFGYTDEATLRYANDLGLAFQLTNILRDVREDAARGRVYLPLDELKRFGVAPETLRTSATTDAVRELFAFQASRARDYYRRAFDQLPDADRHAQRSGLIMAEIYLRLLDEIERDGYRILEHRIRLTPLRKLWIAWRTARRENHRHRRLARTA
ncbi:presqualene diphosphate synthase HpnD [Acidihalobacter ferrooxydans]|uniref:Squalene synthase HpnD n=1 Tax=Acidihalobacter ferrooxydans TaxID=1765967 RepID=A0A1P8UF35_9GAMM|nr:presqualene diphosphate synthase HpnD [Acidihalobacter ferrooxydans]APZ42452.1 squalene synthase HpnD [Acidihalobacter ferrooxydans]